MENTNPMPSPSPEPPIAPKKGLGTGAKIGIGCGIIVILGIIAFVISAVMLGGKLKEFADEAQKNPTRATATMMVKASVGTMEMVAEDDENRRYTIKETNSGKLTTIYWNEQKKAPEVIEGDFSAIPAPTAEPSSEEVALPDASPAPEPGGD